MLTSTSRAPRLACLLALGVLLSPRASFGQASVFVDFGEPADYPLLKDKLNLYDTSLPSTAELERDAKLLGLLNLESMRLELAWGYGQTLSNVVGGSPANLSFDFTAPDRWQQLIEAQGLLLHWSYDYTPKVLSGSAGDVPPEPGWTSCVQRAWQHFHDGKQQVLIHEVWNEPDFPALGFFKGSEQDYYELYARTSKKLRALDPDAKIAGPTTAFPFWLAAFTDYVRAEQLPLDVLTFHQYTRLGQNDHIAQAAAALGRYHDLDTVELVMDEYHPYNPWPKDGPQQTFQGATDLLYDALRFSRRPELTSLNWAQFQEPGHDTNQFLGLVTVDGHPKASFNALRLYGLLPVDSVASTTTGAAIDVMASVDAHRGAIVLLNRTGSDQNVELKLANLPFSQGKVETYRIDRTHNSYLDGAGEQLLPSDTQTDADVGAWSFSGAIPQLGTLAFLFDDQGGLTPKKSVSLGNIVRVNRYYPSRSTSAYADFDRRTWVARLGMVREMQADAEVGVTATGLPPVLRFTSHLSGTPQAVDENTLLGVRFDFDTPQGYSSSVLFYGPYRGTAPLFSAARKARVPFGTLRPPDRSVQVADFAEFSVRLADYAPSDATGRVQISYVMQNTGPGSRVVIETSLPESPVTGDAGSGGTSGSSGSSQGGMSSAGGLSGSSAMSSGGSSTSGGAASSSGAGAAASSGASAAEASASSASCGCRLPQPGGASDAWGALAILCGFALRRRGTGQRVLDSSHV